MNQKHLAIIGYEEGLAGLIHSFIENFSDYKVKLFIHPFDKVLKLDKKSVLANRVVKDFSFPENGEFKGVRFLCKADWVDLCLKLKIKYALVAISDNKVRHDNIAKAKIAGFRLISVAHPSAQIMAGASIGQNCIFLPNAFIGYKSEICDGVILNTGASIDHHCYVDECVSIDPGVVVAGNTSIGKFSKIHSGATIINGIKIGNNVVVGAGSLVIRDVKSNVTVYGVPADVH